MSAIIAALLAAFGPLLAELLKKWLDSLLNKAAKNVGRDADAAELVTEAIRLTPLTRPIRRALLRKMLDHAEDIAAGGKLDAADKKEIKALAKTAE